MSVYFIQSRDGLVKIGYSRNPEKRFRTLRCASPGAVLLGIRDDLSESGLHVRFACSRETGEWFRPSQELLDLATGSDAGPAISQEAPLASTLRRAGVTQKTVAVHLGISEASVSRQIRKPHHMAVSAAIALVDLLSVKTGRPWTLEELFGDAA